MDSPIRGRPGCLARGEITREINNPPRNNARFSDSLKIERSEVIFQCANHDRSRIIDRARELIERNFNRKQLIVYEMKESRETICRTVNLLTKRRIGCFSLIFYTAMFFPNYFPSICKFPSISRIIGLSHQVRTQVRNP